MKLYIFPPAPNPRRLAIFLNEKGIVLDSQLVDLRAGEQFQPEFLAINPCGTVPTLVLDDGTVLTEVIGIYSYLEALYPDNPLMGADPLSRALIISWDHRCFVEGFLAVAETLRNANKAFAGHALPGQVAYEQIPELAERGRRRIHAFYRVLDEHLANRNFMVGEQFSIADIAAWVFVNFSGWVKETVPDDCARLQHWYQATSERPSIQAL